MIRTNLSTRPFYNERIVHLWLIVLAVVVAAATAFNASRVLRYSRSDTRLATQASQDESRVRELHQEAVDAGIRLPEALELVPAQRQCLARFQRDHRSPAGTGTADESEAYFFRRLSCFGEDAVVRVSRSGDDLQIAVHISAISIPSSASSSR